MLGKANAHLSCFSPGWSVHGVKYIYIIYLLASDHRVIVLDQRNHDLSLAVNYGNRISRLSIDLRDFIDHLALEKADFCGWAMG